MDWNNFLARSFTYLFAVLIVLLVGWIVSDAVLSSATGDEYTPEKFWVQEQYYCATYGMVAQEYITNQCSLFGCVEVERTKCVGDLREKKIDYEHEMFCKYTIRGDFGWC